jgi:hypothetical protein
MAHIYCEKSSTQKIKQATNKGVVKAHLVVINIVGYFDSTNP